MGCLQRLEKLIDVGPHLNGLVDPRSVAFALDDLGGLEPGRNVPPGFVGSVLHHSREQQRFAQAVLRVLNNASLRHRRGANNGCGNTDVAMPSLSR